MSKSSIANKLRQYPLAIVCALILLAMVVLIFLRGGVVEALSVTEDDLTARLDLIKDNQLNAPGLKGEVEALEARVEDSRKLLFDRDQRAINTDFFYGMEGKAKVKILEVSQTDAADPATDEGGPNALKQHQVVVFNLAVQGSFEDIVDFFYQIHRVDPFVRIADFEIRASRDALNSEAGTLSARMRVIALARKTEAKK